MGKMPPQFVKGAPPKDKTDPKGPDAQDRLDAMHKGAAASVKAQRNMTHAAGNKPYGK